VESEYGGSKIFSNTELEAGLDAIRQSPALEGKIELIVCRPEREKRKILAEGRMDLKEGLVGDNWYAKNKESGKDPEDQLGRQITLMNARCIALLAGTRDRWPLAGDQLYVDLDLGEENLPPGTRLQAGESILEVTEKPHLGCKKFMTRYGKDALRFVNSPLGVKLHLRGINAKVIREGTVRTGDEIRKML
jgi:MOSC domain-containing protein YiiM